MWEFASGNTFGATAFSSYGGFWISYAFLVSPWSDVAAAYTTTSEFGLAVGFYLMGWFIFTFLMFVASLRSSVGLVSVFFFLTITFMLLGISQFITTNAENVAKAGGAFGLVTAACAWYVALAGLLTPDTAHFVLPVGSLAKRD
jgi:succinate-acetate transporter protein